jgi:hypothetical protein
MPKQLTGRRSDPAASTNAAPWGRAKHHAGRELVWSRQDAAPLTPRPPNLQASLDEAESVAKLRNAADVISSDVS